MTGRVYPEHKKVVIPYRRDIAHLLPMAKPFKTSNGRPFLAVPHELEATRLLHNMGIYVDEPIRHYYDWAGGQSPFLSQVDTAAMLTMQRRAFVLSEMGVGKTRAMLYAFDWTKKNGKARRALVAAPLSTLVTVWENEVFENFPHLATAVLHGDKKKRLKLLGQEADVYIINHDGVEVIQDALWRRPDIDVIIVDELAVYRNSRIDRWKAIKPLVERAKYAWGATGAPTPNDPTDAYGQVKLLKPENVSYSFKAFKEETMQQVSTFTWVARKNANEIVAHAMTPSVRFTRAECFDLPPVTYSNRFISLDPRVTKAYKKMYDELTIEVKNKTITAANEGVKLSKLLQLGSGFVYDADGKGHYIGGIDRVKTVFEIIESCNGKVIVFAPFRYLVELLGATLGKRYAVAIVHGGTSKSDRDAAFLGFQKGATPRVIVAHPQTMAHGLTLTAADTIIWAAPITSPEIYEQANARITRSGQTQHAHIIHLMGCNAEKQVYTRLRKKLKMQGALLEMLRSMQ